jgi:hypothetical protein
LVRRSLKLCAAWHKTWNVVDMNNTISPDPMRFARSDRFLRETVVATKAVCTPVTTLSVSAGDDTASRAYEIVRCPVQASAVAFDKCRSCGRLLRLGGAAPDEVASVTCTVDDDGSAGPRSALCAAAAHAVAVAPEVPIAKLVEAFVDGKLDAVTVVDEERQVLGIITWADMIALVEARDAALKFTEEGVERRVGARLADATAGAIARPCLVALNARATIVDAAAQMAAASARAAPIVDERGHLVAVLTLLDVVRWFGTTPST